MPSRIATRPAGSPESIRALIRSDPSVVEPGFRVLDYDFETGPVTTLDAIGVDRSGRLAIVVVATGDPEAALARLLDGYLWTADQRALLARLYLDRGVTGDRPARGFLLASSFTHAFLRRLSLLSVEITPCLARDVDGGGGARLAIVEPAAALFGLATDERRAPAVAGRDDTRPFWPDGVLPSEQSVSSRGIPMATDAAGPPGAPGPADRDLTGDEMPWPDAPEERFPWDPETEAPGSVLSDGAGVATADEMARPPALARLPDEPAPAGAFEALTAEELEEFERFERQRRERSGRSS